MLNINELLTVGEGLTIEAKEADKGLPQSLWETYSAFANSEGGVILLGVAEVRKKLAIKGVSNSDAMIKSFWDTCNNKNKVNINILLNRRTYVQQIEVIV